jgi:hypothetical protein
MSTEIRLMAIDPSGLTTIEVERPLTHDPEHLWRTLFALRVQVVDADVRVVGTRLRERLHVCEFDGAPMSEHRGRKVTRELQDELGRA